MNTQDFINLENEYGALNYHPLDVVLVKGQGVWVWDIAGNKYLDFLAAYSAVNQGHCHKRIVKVMQEQANKLTLVSRAFRNDKLGIFYEKICKLTGFEKVLPMNSGAEAVETALKLARKWGYEVKKVPEDKAEIIVCQNNFHGRTISIISFSTEDLYKKNFGPFTPGFKVIPYGDISALKQSITENIVAFLVEPAQGEAGIIFPPNDYLQEVRKLCTEKNVLMICDEIQSGMGRTGRIFCYEHSHIKPDVVIVGKALSGGLYPVSAVLSSKNIMDVFTPGTHGSTYSGNPLAAAIACEALDVIIEEKLCENSILMGEYFLNKLKEFKSNIIQEVRGRGLWIGIQLKKEAGGARKYCEKLMQQGLLCKETHEDVIRLAPPLVINKGEIDWACEKLKIILEV